MTFLRYLVLALVAVIGVATAQAQPSFPKLTGRVVDEARLLSADQVAQLTQLSADIESASSRQLVVATVPDLQGYDIADYGYQLLRTWGIGQKDANNGIILIIAPNERKVRIEVGYGLEPIMTDALSSQIINDTILPKFREKDISGGIMAGAQAIAGQMKLPLEAAEQRAQQATQKTTQTRQRGHGGGFPFGLVFWGIIFVFVILPMLGVGRRSRRGPWGVRRYHNDGGVLPIILWSIANEIGRELRGGSGWGGGSGGWGGGGGGGFSGGGGSGGGGGASGSW